MQMQPTYRKPFIAAIALHVLVFLVLATGFQFTGKTFVSENSNTPDVIKATVMPSIPVHPQVTPPQPVQAPTLPPPPVKQQPPRVIPVEKPKMVTPKKDVIALDNKKQKKLQQEQIEKQLLADMKKQQVQHKKLKQKAIEDAFASEIKNLAAKKKLQQREAQRVAGEREQKARGEVDKYKAMVLQAVGRHWLIPDNVDKTLATKLVIYLAPGGMVLDVEVYESSGNPALDNSARAAVFKASPLPVPSEPEAFNFFRRFVLVFKPMYFEREFDL